MKTTKKKVLRQVKTIALFSWNWLEWTALAFFLVTFAIVFAAKAEGLADYDFPRWTRLHTAMIPVLGLIFALLWGVSDTVE